LGLVLNLPSVKNIENSKFAFLKLKNINKIKDSSKFFWEVLGWQGYFQIFLRKLFFKAKDNF